MQKKSVAVLSDGRFWIGFDNRSLPGILAHLYVRRYGISDTGFGRYVEKIDGINPSRGEYDLVAMFCTRSDSMELQFHSDLCR